MLMNENYFGEDGNDSHLRPSWVRVVVEKILAAGGKPFLTDTATLYSGSRQNAYDHMQTAYRHGFVPSVVHAPVILADGLYGENDVPVAIRGRHFRAVHIATEIKRAPAMVTVESNLGAYKNSLSDSKDGKPENSVKGKLDDTITSLKSKIEDIKGTNAKLATEI